MPVGTKPREIVYTIHDEMRKPSYLKINIPSSFSGAQTEAFADAFALLLDAVIDGQIVSYKHSLEMIVPAAVKDAPIGGSDVEEGALFNFRTVNNYPTKFRVATFKEEFMVAGTENVDLSDLTVQAFFEAVEVGLGTPAVQPSDWHSDDISVLVSAYDMHTKER